MKKLDIEQAEPIRKKFAPDWEIRKGKYLYKKVAFDDYNQVLRFLMVIEKPQIKLDHFADVGVFYNEVTMMVYTHDVGGLTQLDFELALYIDEALKLMGAKKLDEIIPAVAAVAGGVARAAGGAVAKAAGRAVGGAVANTISDKLNANKKNKKKPIKSKNRTK
jgi:4a-hydroxytetrahydrobiopterin dehydratase